jgi:hypothetical protein
MCEEMLVKKVEKIEDSSIVRSRGRSKKTIGQTIKGCVWFGRENVKREIGERE